jgi:hypothetical protein
MKKLALALTLTSLAACAPSKTIKNEMYASLPSQKQQVTMKSIEEINRLKPQIVPPIRIAVAQPNRRSDWTSEEIREIESWLPELKASGLANDLVVIPRSLQGACSAASDDCMRTAAAQLHAEAVVSIEESAATDKYVNPLSLLDLTIVGLWLAPGHHRDDYVLYEATLLDTNNGYIYGVAHGEGEAKKIRPYAYADSHTGRNEARVAALKSLGKQFSEKAKSYLTRNQSGATVSIGYRRMELDTSRRRPDCRLFR